MADHVIRPVFVRGVANDGFDDLEAGMVCAMLPEMQALARACSES